MIDDSSSSLFHASQCLQLPYANFLIKSTMSSNPPLRSATGVPVPVRRLARTKGVVRLQYWSILRCYRSSLAPFRGRTQDGHCSSLNEFSFSTSSVKIDFLVKFSFYTSLKLNGHRISKDSVFCAISFLLIASYLLPYHNLSTSCSGSGSEKQVLQLLERDNRYQRVWVYNVPV